jgi:hypothetical protein
MQAIDLVRLEEEMRKLAEERIQAIAGDAPMLTDTQLAAVWGKSTTWVKKMRALGRVPSVQFGGRSQASRAVAIHGLVRGI